MELARLKPNFEFALTEATSLVHSVTFTSARLSPVLFCKKKSFQISFWFSNKQVLAFQRLHLFQKDLKKRDWNPFGYSKAQGFCFGEEGGLQAKLPFTLMEKRSGLLNWRLSMVELCCNKFKFWWTILFWVMVLLLPQRLFSFRKSRFFHEPWRTEFCFPNFEASCFKEELWQNLFLCNCWKRLNGCSIKRFKNFKTENSMLETSSSFFHLLECQNWWTQGFHLLQRMFFLSVL